MNARSCAPLRQKHARAAYVRGYPITGTTHNSYNDSMNKWIKMIQ